MSRIGERPCESMKEMKSVGEHDLTPEGKRVADEVN
jgi:hypothetical protein